MPVDPIVANNTPLPMEPRETTPRDRRRPSPALVWAITAGEAVLWGAFAWFFADYWMMLPVRFRWAGILILAGLAAIGLLRLLMFYRRLRRDKPKRSTL